MLHAGVPLLGMVHSAAVCRLDQETGSHSSATGSDKIGSEVTGSVGCSWRGVGTSRGRGASSSLGTGASVGWHGTAAVRGCSTAGGCGGTLSLRGSAGGGLTRLHHIGTIKSLGELVDVGGRRSRNMNAIDQASLRWVVVLLAEATDPDEVVNV